MTTEELGGGVKDQVGAEIERPQQVGRREGGIDQQRQPAGVGDGRDLRNVEHVEARIAQRLAEQQARLGANRRAPGVGIARIDKGRANAEARQRVFEQVVRAAVERAAGDDVTARAHQRGDHQMQRRLPGGDGDRADTTLERGHPFFQHRRGGIRDARIDMPAPLHVEQGGSLVGILEDERGGQIDGLGARAVLAVGHLAGMQRQRIEFVAHGFILLASAARVF
jgi:hypothetical protein